MKLPFLLINMAMTADGKIATANRSKKHVGDELFLVYDALKSGS